MAQALRRLLPHRGLTAPLLSRYESGSPTPGADVYVAAMDIAKEEGASRAQRLKWDHERANLLLRGIRIGRLKAPELVAKLRILTEPPLEPVVTVEEAKLALGFKHRNSVYYRIAQGDLIGYWWQRQIWVPKRQIER